MYLNPLKQCSMLIMFRTPLEISIAVLIKIVLNYVNDTISTIGDCFQSPQV